MRIINPIATRMESLESELNALIHENCSHPLVHPSLTNRLYNRVNSSLKWPVHRQCYLQVQNVYVMHFVGAETFTFME